MNMPFQSFQATVDRVRDLTHDVRELGLRLRKPKEIQFKAGQFISFDLTPPGGERLMIRPYSIASPPSESDRITLVFNRVPGGRGSTYLFNLKEGDAVAFEGPQGSFYLRERMRNVLFVATGTGIAPIRSMLLDLVNNGYAGTATLYWGLRSQRDVYYQQEFEALAARDPHVSFAIALSRPEAGWQAYAGRVTGLVDARVTSVKNLDVFLCGNHAMIRDVTQIIQAKGLCPIYREIYYDDPSPESL
ncbi:MAG TPA: FAD-binding oxidoreductase [Nitrospiraceae bacterium]|nr:FAD-binding oxidoreductase [Nitrospiraceae bacterium]